MYGAATTVMFVFMNFGEATAGARLHGFHDVSAAVGLGPDVVMETVARVCFADLDGNARPDAVLGGHRVFLNRADEHSPIGVRFLEVPPETTGLHEPAGSSVTVFADLDNDGHLDAIIGEFIDLNNPSWHDHGRRTGWHRGHGDGTFDPQRNHLPVEPKTTAAIAVGDVDRDGRLDVLLGNWYRHYGSSLGGHDNDLLLQPEPGEFQRVPGVTDGYLFADDDEEDRGGRPTYGVMIADIWPNPMWEAPLPELLELNYGRRWNRLLKWNPHVLAVRPSDLRPNIRYPLWEDFAPRIGFDGDAIRHGRHPAWLAERAKTDPRFDRPDEKPFRSNGNTFDCAVGDINNNGLFDIFVSEITHGWAGDSSDRSRFLFNDGHRFIDDERFNVDRVPPAPDNGTEPHNWNQGDLFCELADFDHNGLLDLVLSSGDYPDDQRLRIYLQHQGEGLRDATEELAIDHDGSQQIALADVDGDGALDILVGQTFNRLTPTQREGRSPRLRLFHNRAAHERHSITLRLEGDGQTTSRDALGAIVKVRIGEQELQQQLVGIGGHAGKQHDFILHFGIGEADSVDELIVIWPDADATVQVFENVAAGAYRLTQHGDLKAEDRRE